MSEYITPNRAHAALLTVDAQRDYCDPDSPVKSAGAASCREPLGRLVRALRGAGMPVFHTLRYYRPDGSNVDLCRRDAVEEGMRVLMPGSLGAEPLAEMMPATAPRVDAQLLIDGGVQDLGPREEALYKPRWGAFYRTALEQRLQNLGIDTLVIAGCNFATSGRATVLEASERDYRIVLVPEAAGGLSAEAQQDLARIGVSLMDLDCCVAWAEGRQRPTRAA
jgi:nicotinamidase-related amidase